MKFTNLGGPIKIRIGEPGKCYWKTIQMNEVADLPEKQGRSLGLRVVTTEGKIGNHVVETKQVDTDNDTDNETVKQNFLKELISINGIGKKTAEDVVRVFKTKKILLEAVESGLRFPLRDDVEEKLRRKYGRK